MPHKSRRRSRGFSVCAPPIEKAGQVHAVVLGLNPPVNTTLMKHHHTALPGELLQGQAVRTPTAAMTDPALGWGGIPKIFFFSPIFRLFIRPSVQTRMAVG